MNLSYGRIVFAVMLFAVCTCGSAEELVVIVNPRNATARITPDQLDQLFLGKTASLPGGGNATVVDQTSGSPVHDVFYQRAAGKSAVQVKAIWSRLIFSGKATPPRTFGSSADVKRFVASESNAIGYIERSAADTSVKVVLALP